jgi:hypothetical protein
VDVAVSEISLRLRLEFLKGTSQGGFHGISCGFYGDFIGSEIPILMGFYGQRLGVFDRINTVI